LVCYCLFVVSAKDSGYEIILTFSHIVADGIFTSSLVYSFVCHLFYLLSLIWIVCVLPCVPVGLSASYVLKQLLHHLFANLSNPSTSSASSSDLPSSSIPLPVPLDHQLDLRPHLADIFSALLPSPRSLFSSSSPPPYLGEQPTVPYPRLTTKLYFLSLTPSMVASLTSLARTHSLTFHSVLSSCAIVTSYVLAQRSYTAPSKMTITCASPASGKRMP
jgi:hypothetical protein